MNRKFFISVNFIIASLLLISFFGTRLSPDKFWPGSFLGFLFPYFAILNMLFVVFWLLVKRRITLISMVAMAICYDGVVSSFSLPVKEENGKVNLISYNVKNFDLYNWSRNKESRQKMLEIIKRENPDIICFQEFFTNEKEEFDNIKKIHEEFGYKHFHYEESKKYLKNHWGAATFSKYPIVNKGRIEFNDSIKNMSIFTDIKIEDEIFRIYNLHLQSYYMVDEDYEFLRSISDLKIPKQGSFMSILSKLRAGFSKRSIQAEMISKHVSSFDGYTIVCGDFNDVPISYAYHKISSGLKDSYKFRAAGMGKTFVSSLPSLRIDYIFVDEKIDVDQYRRLPYKYSDHYPIMISFSF